MENITSTNLHKPPPSIIHHYQPASIDIALQYSKTLSVKSSQSALPFCKFNSQFYQQFGPGPYLFFSFTKKLCYLFIVLTVISFIQFGINLKSNCENVSATSITLSIMKTSIGCISPQQSTSFYYLTIVLDCIYSLVILSYLLYEDYYLRKTVHNYRLSNALASYYTIQVSNLPSETNEQKIRHFFSQFGAVKQIVGVRAYSNQITTCKKICSLSLKINESKIKKSLSQQQLYELSQKKQELINQLDYEIEFNKGRIIKYFIMFQHIADRQKTLHKFHKYQTLFRMFRSYPEKLKFQNKYVLDVQTCQIEPESIIWQNVHIIGWERIIRSMCQFFLIVACIFVGFLVICLLTIIGAFPNVTSESTYSYQYVRSLNNSLVSYNWCIGKAVNELRGNYQHYQFCQNDISQYYKLVGIYVVVSFVIILIKQVMIRLVYLLGKIQKFHSYNQYHSWLLVGLFLVNIITTMFITIMVQAELDGISIKKILTIFTNNPTVSINVEKTTSYNDLTQGWYFDTGYKLVTNFLILNLFPLISQPLFLLFQHLYKRFQASRQVIQYKLNKIIAPNNFSFEQEYADVLSLVFICWTLSGSIPLLNVICLIGIIIRCIWWRIYFVYYCRVPHQFNQLLAKKALTTLVWGLFLHLMISLFAYGNPGLLPSPSWVKERSDERVSRLAFSWPLTAVLCIVVMVYLVKVIVIDACRNWRKNVNKHHLPTVIVQRSTNSLGTDDKKVKSYKMKDNPRYKEVYVGLKQAVRKYTIQMGESTGMELDEILENV